MLTLEDFYSRVQKALPLFQDGSIILAASVGGSKGTLR
jgi:hypothetical protein